MPRVACTLVSRQARSALRGHENNLKGERGFLEILGDPAFLARKRAEESTLRRAVGTFAEVM